MKNLITFSVLFFLSFSVFSQKYYPTSSGEFVNHIDFALSYNEEHEQANWVYYILSKKMVDCIGVERNENFREDKKVSTGSASLNDYKGSGYDRGHLCPAGDMKRYNSSMSNSFLLSNMSPQDPSFNRGIWKKLEARVRFFAVHEDEIHVVTGPIFKDNKGSIGRNNVTIPGYYYKVIYDPTDKQKMIALILPNEKGTKELTNYIVTVDSVESLTNIDFFPDLPDSIENLLESQNTKELWDFGNFKSSYTPATSSNDNPSSTSVNSSTTSTQCKAIVKTTGSRCKRMTTNTNEYCWQHQDQVGKTNTTIQPKAYSSGRCQAIAKSTGQQCKRNAEAGSRYCWQHK